MSSAVPIAPLHFPRFSLLNFGEIVDDPKYYRTGNEVIVFPVGYKMVRREQSYLHPETETDFVAEIRRGVDGPEFVVSASDDENGAPFVATSATSVWQLVVRRQKPDKVVSVSGLAKYALNDRFVQTILRQLKGGEALFRRLEESLLLKAIRKNAAAPTTETVATAGDSAVPATLSTDSASADTAAAGGPPRKTKASC